MEPLGLYIHIPFCKAKCAYCDFYSLPVRTEETMDAYTAALCRHLRSAAPSADGHAADRYTVDTVYFGGGTPSYLGQRRLLEIWDTVTQSYRIAADAEVTLEANPDSCGPWMSALREAGFNRISLGMQSAIDRELRNIGRVHTSAQTVRAVEAVRRAGFANLSLDLMYGLPRQSMEDWQYTVRTAAALGPEHLSCYGLKVEEGTPLSLRRETAGLPDGEAQADFYLWAVEELSRLGYGQYEISNFARPGRASRHNWKYWTLRPYLGFGPGAHSDFGGVRSAWARDLEGYIRDAPRPAYSERTAISPQERAREWVMLSLRTVRGLDPSDCVRRFGEDGGTVETEKSAAPDIPLFQRFTPFLEQCRRAGYAVREGNRWRLTAAGFLVSNQIIGELLDRMEANEQTGTAG